jgi:serine/threonine-protein kinase
MLTGRPPFLRDNVVELIDAHIREEPVPPSQYNSAIPSESEQVIHKCLVKDPVDRFQDMSALAHAFSQCEASGHWSRDEAARWWQEREEPA